MTDRPRYITLAIHTYDKAVALRSLLESEGIAAELHNVNLEVPGLSSGVRVRIPETDLPLALRIVENRELFASDASADAHAFLVPVDFSEISYKAVEVACRLAAGRNASIHLLYSYIDPYIAGNMQFTDSLTYDVGEPGAHKLLEENADKLMRNFCDRLRAAMRRGDLPPVRLQHKVLEGVPEDSIAEYARDIKPSLIIMGTRGAEKKEAEAIGSVTAEVLDEGRFTVLTVPEPVEAEQSLHPTNILFFSGLDQNDILAIDTLYRLFGGSGAKVTIVHMPQRHRFSDKSAGKALQRLSQYCEKNFNDYQFEAVPLTQPVDENTFTAMQADRSFDLIVTPNRRRNAFSRLFNPGLAHKLIFHTDLPMLVIPV